MALFSTITSSVFPDFVVVYRGSDFYNDVYSTLVANARDVDSWNEARSNRARAELGELGDEATWYHRQFEVFREMRKARDFRLVLQACYVGDDSVRELQRAVAAEMAVPGGLPITVSMPYTPRAHRRTQKRHPLWVPLKHAPPGFSHFNSQAHLTAAPPACA